MVMKYAQNSDILPHLLDMKAMLAEIGGVNYLYIEAIFKYIINQAETDEIYKVLDIFKEVVPERDKTKLMTIAERLKQEGIQLGKQEGIQLGEQRIREIVLNMLAEGQSIAFIGKVTGLSEAEIQKIADSKNNTH
jgi:predicted transposase/invertase (TIGR01784 family)